MNERLNRLLRESRVEYEVILHRDAYTAQEIAANVHVSGRQLAKVVMVKEPGGLFLMAVVPASHRVDLEHLGRVSRTGDLSLATENEFAPLFPDCEIGSMPPFGTLYGIPVYIDESFQRVRDVVFEAGSHHEAVRMRFEDYARLVRPTIGAISNLWVSTPVQLEGAAS